MLVRGEEESDHTYRLSPAQQHRARNLAVVAAMPVTNARGQVIAVISASSVDPESPLATDEGFDAHLLLAQEVARLFVDLFGGSQTDTLGIAKDKEKPFNGSGGSLGHQTTPVSADDVVRVVSQALVQRTGRREPPASEGLNPLGLADASGSEARMARGPQSRLPAVSFRGVAAST